MTTTENAWTFGVYIDDELAASLRLHVATKDCPVFPTLAVFPDLLEPELQAGKTIIDPTRLVTDQRLARLYPSLPYITLRLCWMAAMHFEADHFACRRTARASGVLPAHVQSTPHLRAAPLPTSQQAD